MRRSIIGAAFLGAGLTACTSTSSFQNPQNFPAGPTPAPVTQHLYVGDDNTAGFLRVYNLPLSGSSVPVAMVPVNKSFAVGANASNVAVVTLNDQVMIYAQPLTSTSTPIATFASTNDGTPIFAANGSLFQGGAGVINVYTPPFVNNMQPSSMIPSPVGAGYLALDTNGTLYANGGANKIGVISNGNLTQTYSAPAGTQYRGMFATSSQLFAVWFMSNPFTEGVDIFNLPLTSGSKPAVTITKGLTSVEGVAVDSSGNLYVGNIDNGAIGVYTPPFSASSAPVLTLNTGAIIFGITIGP